MSLKYLLDENVERSYKTQIARQRPDLVVWFVGDPYAPAKGTLDPDILIWCEEYDFVLVTNNRASMPVHLTAHLEAGRHIPGIFILNSTLSMGETIELLILLAEASFDDEYQDLIVHLQ
ncbi:MAG: DUF5615 family PIN-like protein [Spirulinaceae cyanobacterium SM2_1_0]|nr:DUF5615 family PIN-like protein [Spirulinaceae cyanobacterium SM2_1_0]